MKLSILDSAIGMAALTGLAGVHWLREHQPIGLGIGHYLLGVLPNFFAAVAIPFVFLGACAFQTPGAAWLRSRRGPIVVTLFSAAGLLVWEVMQRGSHALVFDWNDIGATAVGCVTSFGALAWLHTPAQFEASRQTRNS